MGKPGSCCPRKLRVLEQLREGHLGGSGLVLSTWTLTYPTRLLSWLPSGAVAWLFGLSFPSVKWVCCSAHF